MGYRHSREEILTAALDAAGEVGLSRLTFGRVAERLGISDRTVVYYFPTKDDLATNVVLALGARLQAALAEAFAPSGDHRELVRAAWPVITRPEHDRVFDLFFEANGLATAGRAPFADLVPAIVDTWVEWLMTFLDGDGDVRRAEAEATVVLVDGLLLLRQVAGHDAASRAANVLGVVGPVGGETSNG